MEARELIIMLHPSLREYDPEALLKIFAAKFKTEYGLECHAGLHLNHAKSNYHIHLIYSERRPLENPEVKIASRNMFYDENGKHRRTKKEILDEHGNIRPGCKIVPKGTDYDCKFFGPKDNRVGSPAFLDEVKHMYTDLINELVKDEAERLSVFDRNGPYLATKKIGNSHGVALFLMALFVPVVGYVVGIVLYNENKKKSAKKCIVGATVGLVLIGIITIVASIAPYLIFYGNIL